MEQLSQATKTIKWHLTSPPELRRRAEDLYTSQRLEETQGSSKIDTSMMLYELQVRQLELEIQNEELRTIREDLDTALERYTDLYNFSPVGYFTLNEQGRIIEANLTGELMLQVARERLIDRGFIEFVAIDERPVLQGFLKRLLATDVTQQCDLRLLMHHKQSLYVHLEGLYAPEVASDERQIRLSVSDMTDQKRAEQMRLVQSRIEASATLAAGIAHDFNNMMAVILGNVELLQIDLSNHHTIHSRLSIIAETARKASELTELMLAYAHEGNHTSTVVDMGEIVRTIHRQQMDTLPQGMQIQSDLAPDLWKIKADPAQMSMVVMGLLRNAIESITETGVIGVTTRNLEIDPMAIQPHQLESITPGKYVHLTVEDTGCGMTREVLDRVFEPFFTTKFQGRGMGLAAVYGIVKHHGGYIMATSVPDYGTRFMVYLPAL